jgi:malate synthase
MNVIRRFIEWNRELSETAEENQKWMDKVYEEHKDYIDQNFRETIKAMIFGKRR